MNTQAMIEAFGYLGSALVLVSFLMVSVVKLRIINTIGSTIFTIYAFIIHSYPTALMNFCLVLINIYYIVKLSNTKGTEYSFIKADTNDSFIKYTIDFYKKDIEKCFPGISLDFANANSSYIVSNNGKPAGIMIGQLDGSTLDLLLDYSIPEYRDFSIGKFAFDKLKGEGITNVIYKGVVTHHKEYLKNTGFVAKDGYYEKTL